MAEGLVFNLVRFRGVPVTLDGPFVWRAGFEAEVNSFRVPADGLARLFGVGADLDEPGRLAFYFTSDATPDLAIEGVRVVDVESIGLTQDEAGRAYVPEYRLLVADRREAFAPPRGGRVTLGPVVNPDGGPVARSMPNREVIQHLLGKMGVTADVPADVDAFPPIRNRPWFGKNAAEEARKVFEEFGLVLCPQYGGGFKVHFIGEGPGPASPPAERVLPSVDLLGLDRRGKTVIVTSAPNAAIETVTLTGPRADTWEFVAEHPEPKDVTDSPWVKLVDLPGLGGETPLKAVQGRLQKVDQKYQGTYNAQLYRHIRLNREKHPQTILRTVRRLRREPDKQSVSLEDLGLQIEAKIAVRDPTSGLWKNSDDFVKLTPVGLINPQGSYGTVIAVRETLLKLEGTGQTDDPFGNAKELEDGDLKVSFSRQILNDKVTPPALVFFNHGVRQKVGGDAKVVKGEEAEQALDDPQTVVLYRPELRLVQEEGQDDNRPDLEERAEQLARRYVRGSGDPARIVSATGFFKVELSGRVAEVRFTQTPPRTDARVNTWWLPTEYYLAAAKRRAGPGGQAFPMQAETSGQRLAEGSAGSTQPAVPLSFPPGAPAPPAGCFPVLCTVDGGQPGSLKDAQTCDLTYKLETITGQPLKNTRGEPVVKQTPAVPRIANCRYVSPPARTLGLAYRNQEGAPKLYHVSKEMPAGATTTNASGLRVQGLEIQAETQQITVLDAGPKTWATIHTGAECQPGEGGGA